MISLITAYHTFGRHGKLVIELSIIGLTIGCLVSFFVVIGDLAPPIFANSLGINWVGCSVLPSLSKLSSFS
jgi:amino acid permease